PRQTCASPGDNALPATRSLLVVLTESRCGRVEWVSFRRAEKLPFPAPGLPQAKWGRPTPPGKSFRSGWKGLSRDDSTDRQSSAKAARWYRDPAVLRFAKDLSDEGCVAEG